MNQRHRVRFCGSQPRNASRRASASPHPDSHPAAFSLLELLAVVTILGIVALIIVPRFGNHAADAKANACDVNRGNIEVQCQLWFRHKGSWPKDNLSDIGAHKGYFPDGLPKCPVDNSGYQFDAVTEQVTGHTH